MISDVVISILLYIVAKGSLALIFEVKLFASHDGAWAVGPRHTSLWKEGIEHYNNILVKLNNHQTCHVLV